jgi:hypothetical protein
MEAFVDLQFAHGTSKRVRAALKSAGVLKCPKL